MVYWLAPLIALLASLALVGLLRGWLDRLGVVDVPMERSSHQRPTPRGGGVGIVLAFGLSVATAMAVDGDWWSGRGQAPALRLPDGPLLGLLAGAGLVGLVGLLDDLRSRPPMFRLIAQCLASAIFVAGAGAIDALRVPMLGEVRLGVMGPPLTILWLVVITNVFNFMDGIDGLAAGQAAIAGLALAGAAAYIGNQAVTLLSACLAAAALGFLVHNFAPARVFMGDVGSTFIGFVFAALAVLGAQPGSGRISIYVSALLVAPFLFDAILTLFTRALRGEKWYAPHRSHLYQRLVKAGYSHRRVSLVYYLLALTLAGLGLLEVATGQGATDWFLLLGLLPLVLLVVWVRRVESSGSALRPAET